MAKQSPTSRTLQECRRLGWIAQVVEHRVPRLWITRDLFGVIDVVALTDTGEILGIQACVGASHAARRDKILAELRALRWLECRGRLEVWSWTKQGAVGKRKRWTLRDEKITAEMFELQQTKEAA